MTPTSFYEQDKKVQMIQKTALNLFSIFHLNLAFSSIDEEKRPEVIRRCYWPLLRLAEKLNFPLGIEASAYTLETINAGTVVPRSRRVLREVPAVERDGLGRKPLGR